MRVALIADVHGNSLGLDAVLVALDRDQPGEVVFLGDAVANGPDPVGALERLRRLAPLAVMGNTDADILDTPHFYRPPRRDQLPPAAQKVLAIGLWGHEQLTAEDRRFIGTFAPTVSVALPGDRTLLGFHGSPAPPPTSSPPPSPTTTSPRCSARRTHRSWRAVTPTCRSCGATAG